MSPTTVHPRRRLAILVSALAAMVLAACAGAPASPSTSTPPGLSPSLTAAAVTPRSSATADATTQPTPPPLPTASASATAEPTVDGTLGEALEYVPATAGRLYFTDWQQVRESLGLTELTGASRLDEKFEGLRPLLRIPATETVFTGGVSNLRTDFDHWGFDVFDLDWELETFGPDVARLTVLRFRDAAAGARLTAKLDEYGFTQHQLAHGSLRTLSQSELLQKVPGYQRFEMANAALFDDGLTVALAPGHAQGNDARVLEEYLIGGVHGSVPAGFATVAAALDRPLTALITDSTACASFAGRYSPEHQPMVDALLARAGSLNDYQALGLGYSRAHDPIGRFALAYPKPADAEADLPGRALLAREGITSSMHGLPYAEAAFAVESARTEGASLVLDVTAYDDNPGRLFLLYAQRDLLFATCASPT